LEEAYKKVENEEKLINKYIIEFRREKAYYHKKFCFYDKAGE
jgi:hypothetical protein